VFAPKYRKLLFGKSGGTWTLDPAKVFSGGGKLNLDCAECGTQAAQFSWPQFLGERLFRFDRRAGQGDDPHLHQKSGDRGQSS
jgi:hypothetical protein